MAQLAIVAPNIPNTQLWKTELGAGPDFKSTD
jgi:hypothetical protein